MNLFEGDFMKAWDMNLQDRQAMVKWLTKKLLLPDRTMVRQQVDELIDSNNLILNTVNPGCAFRNDWLERGGRIVSNLGWDPQLHESLWYRAEGLADRWRLLEKDVEHISDLFSALTAKCERWQDFRDALPDCVIQFESTLRSYPRTRPESDFQGKSLRFRYEMLLPRLHTYAAMHLLT